MEVSEKNNLNFEKKTSKALKADHSVHHVTFNPNKASPTETLNISVPKLDDGVVLVSECLVVVFNLTVVGKRIIFS